MTEVVTVGSAIAGGPSLVRNSAWNLAGHLLPLLAAVVAIPILIEAMGVERFGVLMLAWVVIGYFSLFDLGLGRAMTQLLAEKLGQGRSGDIAPLVWTGLSLMAGLGIVGALLLLALSGWLLAHGFGVAAALQAEVAAAWNWLIWAIPAVILSTGLRGVLEAMQRFDLVNWVRIPVGVLMFVAPVLALPFSNQIDVMVALLLGLRVLMGLAYALMALRVWPALKRPARLSGAAARRLLTFGGWMTVTNVVGPLMVFGDRFVIGAVLGAAAVAYYATPHEVITRLLIIPAALVGVLFPIFASSLVSDRLRAVDLFQRGWRWVLLLVFPPVLLAVVFADDLLRLWISEEFAQHGAVVLMWLAAGVLLNSLAQLPFAWVQAAGRPDLTAKLHLAELPPYLLLLWFFMHQWGLAGAAAAWALRAAFDCAVLAFMAAQIESGLRRQLRIDAGLVVLSLLVLAVGAGLTALLHEALFVGLTLVIFVYLGWSRLLRQEERTYLCLMLYPNSALSKHIE